MQILLNLLNMKLLLRITNSAIQVFVTMITITHMKRQLIDTKGF